MTRTKSIIAASLAASLAATAANPANAWCNYYGCDYGYDNSGALIAGGIMGLAVGAMIAEPPRNKHSKCKRRCAPRGMEIRITRGHGAGDGCVEGNGHDAGFVFGGDVDRGDGRAYALDKQTGI
jgi:hypothetical protein